MAVGMNSGIDDNPQDSCRTLLLMSDGDHNDDNNNKGKWQQQYKRKRRREAAKQQQQQEQQQQSSASSCRRQLSLSDDDDDDDDNKKSPNRFVLYLRNQSSTCIFMTRTNRASASSTGNNNKTARTMVTFTTIGVILATLMIHRLVSMYMTNRQWINAPITYIARECPRPTYKTIGAALAEAGAGAGAVEVKGTSGAKAGGANAKKPKICVTTLTDRHSTSYVQRLLRWRDYDNVLDITWENKQDYAKKHGYLLYDGSKHIDGDRPPAWSKIPAVLHLLDMKTNGGGDEHGSNRCDYVLWTDADTVFMNSDKRIEDFIPLEDSNSKNSGDLIVGSDNGGGYNSGVFLVRNTAWSKRFMNDWWNMKSYVRPPGFSLSGDNNAMKALLQNLKEQAEDEDDSAAGAAAAPALPSASTNKIPLHESGTRGSSSHISRRQQQHQQPRRGQSGDGGDNNNNNNSGTFISTFDRHVLVPERCTLNSFAKFLSLSESIDVMKHLHSQTWYQSHDYYHHGDFIAHIAGYDNKSECLKLLLKEAT